MLGQPQPLHRVKWGPQKSVGHRHHPSRPRVWSTTLAAGWGQREEGRAEAVGPLLWSVISLPLPLQRSVGTCACHTLPHNLSWHFPCLPPSPHQASLTPPREPSSKGTSPLHKAREASLHSEPLGPPGAWRFLSIISAWFLQLQGVSKAQLSDLLKKTEKLLSTHLVLCTWPQSCHGGASLPQAPCWPTTLEKEGAEFAGSLTTVGS